MTTERDDYYEPAIAKTPTRHVDGRTTIMNSELRRLQAIEAAAKRCTCPTKIDDHTRAVVRAMTDQLCPVHGTKRQELPHCPTCACQEGKRG